MARAFKCDSCGKLVEGEPNAGGARILLGDNILACVDFVNRKRLGHLGEFCLVCRDRLMADLAAAIPDKTKYVNEPKAPDVNAHDNWFGPTPPPPPEPKGGFFEGLDNLEPAP